MKTHGEDRKHQAVGRGEMCWGKSRTTVVGEAGSEQQNQAQGNAEPDEKSHANPGKQQATHGGRVDPVGTSVKIMSSRPESQSALRRRR